MKAYNQFYLCLRNADPVLWPQRPPYRGGLGYLNKTFGVLDELLGPRDLTFFVTREDRRLPSYGRNVIAVSIGDEWARLPAYASKIAVTFKEYGTRLAPPIVNSHLGSSVVALAQYSRNAVARLPAAISQRLSTLPSPVVRPIPLGYLNTNTVPFIPFNEREISVSFIGSVEHETYKGLSPQRFVGTAKSHSRRAMLDSLSHFRLSNPAIACDVGVTSSYVSSTSSFEDTYSDRLMRTRICLCPRGMSLETYRFFEALSLGCIVIAEALPDHWFYRGSPAIIVKRWSDLSGILEHLLGDEARMEEIHHATVRWWNEVCSEQALAAYMAKVVLESMREAY